MANGRGSDTHNFTYRLTDRLSIKVHSVWEFLKVDSMEDLSYRLLRRSFGVFDITFDVPSISMITKLPSVQYGRRAVLGAHTRGRSTCSFANNSVLDAI